MKKLFLSVLIGAFYLVKAQPYSFVQSAATYSTLSNPVVVSGSSPWTSFQSFAVPVGFTFNFMGNNYNTINIEGSGFTFFDPNYYYLINPFTVPLKDKGTSSSLSPLSYLLTGTSPSRILKIQWQNCGFQNEPNSTANFQLWLYEQGNRIEVHIGPCTVVNPTSAYSGNGSPGPVIGIFEYANASNCTYSLSLYGPPTAADDSMRTGNLNFFGVSLNGTPANGTVYEFNPQQLGMNDFYEENQIGVYPNPVENLLYFSEDPAEVWLYSAAGELLRTYIRPSEIDLRFFGNGIYVLFIEKPDGRLQINKIIKKPQG